MSAKVNPSRPVRGNGHKRTTCQSDPMKTLTTGNLSALIAFAVQVLCSSCHKDAAPALSLVDYLDQPKLEKAEIPKAIFVQSAFDLEGLLASALATKEVNGARVIAKNLSVVVATQHEGEQEVIVGPASVRDVLNRCAAKWQFGVLVDGDTIMMIDPSDVSRFEHRVALLP